MGIFRSCIRLPCRPESAPGVPPAAVIGALIRGDLGITWRMRPVSVSIPRIRRRSRRGTPGRRIGCWFARFRSASRCRSGCRAVSAQAAQYAYVTAWLLCPADRSPVSDHRHMQVVRDAGWHSRREELVCPVRGQLLNVPAGQAIPQVPADGDRDHLPREPEASEDRARARGSSHQTSLWPPTIGQHNSAPSCSSGPGRIDSWK
jgi:hypothetical protein